MLPFLHLSLIKSMDNNQDLDYFPYLALGVQKMCVKLEGLSLSFFISLSHTCTIGEILSRLAAFVPIIMKSSLLSAPDDLSLLDDTWPHLFRVPPDIATASKTLGTSLSLFLLSLCLCVMYMWCVREM